MAAVAVVAAVTIGALLIREHVLSVGLMPDGSYSGGGVREGKIGRPVNVGTGPVPAKGDRPVHVEAVEVVGLPDGLRLQGVYAERLGPRGTVGVLEGDLMSGPDARDYRPVTEVVIHPGRQEWAFVVVVVPERLGTFKTEGIRVSWRAGWRTGTTTYRRFLEVTVVE